MTTKTITRRRFVGAALAGSAAAAVLGFSARKARAQTVPLKVSYSKTAIHHSPFVYLTQNAQKYGFSIDLLNFERYADALVALQNGQLNFSGLGYVNIPTIVDRKMDKIKIIAGNMLGGSEIVVRRDIKVNTWKDLEGLKIAASANSMGEHMLRLNAQEHGFDINKVNFVRMVPGPAALIALKQREIDGLIAWEPWAAQIVVEGTGYIPKPRLGDSSIGQINGVLGTNADYAAANRDVVVRFVKALSEINAYLTRNVDEHVKTAVGFMGIQPAVARKAIESFTYDDNIYMKNTRFYAKLVHGYGLTKIDTSDQVHNVVDFSFLEAASGKNRKQLGDV